MDRKISHLQPNSLWTYFEEICQVPRPSKNEEKIIEFMRQFSAQHQLHFESDAIGNVLIRKAASVGCENSPTIILQSHMDMVCEKNNSVEHDFRIDPIKPFIDGEWVKAQGTTLGADCGIGMAAAMAVLTSKEAIHGPIEALFTVDEETGLTGAANLQPGFLEGKILVNLDSEDEGQLFIGCAGGIDTIAQLYYSKHPIPSGWFPMEMKVGGLLGGHSGDDIDKFRANAIQLLVRFLWEACQQYGAKLVHIEGGNLRNAIAREAKALFIVQNGYKEKIVGDFNIYKHEVLAELVLNEPNLQIQLSSADMPDVVLSDQETEKLLGALYVCPHGVQAMSPEMPGMVRTSTNLASVKFINDNTIEITTSQRSEVESSKKDIAAKVAAAFHLVGANVRHTDGYPGWKPNPESSVVNTTIKAYEALFGEKPLVRSIHAGLECGLFLQKYPGLDMVSFGPTIKGAHSPDERLHIESVSKFWKHLLEVLRRLAVD